MAVVSVNYRLYVSMLSMQVIDGYLKVSVCCRFLVLVRVGRCVSSRTSVRIVAASAVATAVKVRVVSVNGPWLGGMVVSSEVASSMTVGVLVRTSSLSTANYGLTTG